MATTENGIYYPNDGTKVADILTDLKAIAESVDKNIQENKFDDKDVKKDISDIKKEQETQNADIENLQTNDIKQYSLISKLKNATLNAETEESKSLHVEDANKFGQLEVFGNQEQETRSGKNLFDKNNMNILQGYIDGSGSIIYNTSNKIAYIECPKNTDITVSGKYLRGIACYNQLPTYNLQTSVKNINQATYLTLNTGDNTYLAVWYYENNSGYTEQEITDTVQVEVGNVATEYEQYGASPSPDYPSPIKCLGSNKNLLDLKAQSRNGITVTKNADDTLNITGTATVSGILALLNKNIVLKANKSYTFSVKKVSGQDISNSIWFWNVTDLNSEITLTLSKNIKTFTFTKDTTLIALNISVNQGDVFDITLALKLEEGTEATSYSPYGQGSTEIKMKNADETQEKSYTLPIQQEMLSGDYFVKESDGWKEVHYTPKKIFTGEENWLFGSTKTNTQVFNIYIPQIINNFVYSNYFHFTDTMEDIENIKVVSDNLYIAINKSRLTENTLQAFKQFLQEKYSSGNPVYAFYKTETPTKLPCTAEQNAVLEELNNLDLFEGVNNIITAEDISLLKLKYALDVETYIDNKLNTINQQILEIAGGNG